MDTGIPVSGCRRGLRVGLGSAGEGPHHQRVRRGPGTARSSGEGPAPPERQARARTARIRAVSPPDRQARARTVSGSSKKRAPSPVEPKQPRHNARRLGGGMAARETHTNGSKREVNGESSDAGSSSVLISAQRMPGRGWSDRKKVPVTAPESRHGSRVLTPGPRHVSGSCLPSHLSSPVAALESRHGSRVLRPSPGPVSGSCLPSWPS